MRTFHRPSCIVVALLLSSPVLVRRTHAFADYLLSGGGCWTELSPDEVIMNHAVVEAEHVEGPNLKIVVEGHEANSDGQVQLSSFPQTVKVKVAGGEHLRLYQYVLDVVGPEEDADITKKKGPLASFEGGKCTDERRVAGNSKDGPRTLVVHGSGARIVAGWATSHEAVKLTPFVTFVGEEMGGGGGGGGGDGPADAPAGGEKVDTEPDEWISALIEGCPEVVEAKQVGTFPIVHSPIKLQASKAERDNQVQLKWPGTLLPPPTSRKVVLVSSSSDAGFEGGACGGVTAAQHTGPREVVSSDPGTHEVPIPVLTIHKPHTIKVYAYSFDATSRSIQRTDPFVLTWVPDPPPPPKAKKHDANEADPQKVADAKVRADPHLLHQQAHAYQGKDRAEATDKTGSSEKFPVHADDLDATSPDERHPHNHHLSQEEESVVDDDAASLDQHPGHRKEGTGPRQKDHPPKQHGEDVDKRKEQALPQHRRGFHKALLHRGAAGAGAAATAGRSVRFTVTSSYYAGIVILVVAPIAVVQACLRASRKAKGRRTL